MVLPLDEDLAEIFADQHGVEALWTPTGGDEVGVNGFFTDRNLLINPYTGELEQNVDATFFCQYSEMGAAKQGEPLVIDSVTYTIKKVPSSVSNVTMLIGLKK